MLYYKMRCPLLLVSFVNFLRCISKMRGASDSMTEPLMVHTIQFLLRLTLKLHINQRFWAPSQQRKWNGVNCGGTFIAAEVFHILPYMDKEDVRRFS